MTSPTKVRFVAMGRLTLQPVNWELEFVTPMMREAVLRTVKESLAEQGAELAQEEPEAAWHKNGRLVNDTTVGAMPCWVWWVK